MKLRSPLLIRLFAAIASAIIWCWMSTMRKRTLCLDGRQHPLDPRHERMLYLFWHEAILVPLTLGVNAEILISQHADGEFIAQVAQHFGLGVIRGSSTRGGAGALHSMINARERQRHLAITPDGPRGPRRRLQLGSIIVASASGVPIVPLGIGFARAYRATSWDRFAVPCPFSTICLVTGNPIHVPRNLDRAGLEQWRARVEERFIHVSQLADDWADRIDREGKRAAPPEASDIRNAA